MSSQILGVVGNFILGSVIFSVILPVTLLAHGGEDHGDQKPKTVANAKGIVSHSSRLGDLEVMVKHPAMEPDKSTTGSVFLTKFETNEPFKAVEVKVEAESTSGSVFVAKVEPGEQTGVYKLTFPAMPEGVYAMRAKVTHDGETDTATFSGIDVKSAAATTQAVGSWVSGALIGLLFFSVIVLLVGLAYFVWRFAAGPGAGEEAVSA